MPEGKVNLLIFHPPVDAAGDWGPVTEDSLRQISAVNSRIKARDASVLAEAAEKGDATAEKQFDALLAQAEIIWALRPPKNLITRAPRLKWIQSPVSGVDSFAVADVMNSDVVLTNSSGIHGTQVGEMAVALMIMLAKKAPRIFNQMREMRHQAFVPVVLESKTVGILGLGPIGKSIARLSKGFRMKVLGVEARQSVNCRYTDAIFPTEKLREVISQCDFVVNALPLLASTRKVIGEPELRAMKPTSFFINIGRGGTVDQEALIRALSENWIAGAGLDTVTPEPLPPDDKLWKVPNIIITPHVSGRREDYLQLATDLFCKNLERYLSGKKVFNIINKKTLTPR